MTTAPRVGRLDIVTALLGVWLVAGGLFDAWHHARNDVDSIFSGAHAVLYSGFLAFAAWIVISARRAHGLDPTARLGSVGVAIFGVGAVGDLAWHSVFGIERQIAAVTSPTHLTLFAGAAIMLALPIVRAWRDGEALGGFAAASVIISATMLALLVSLLLFFASPFAFRDFGGPFAARWGLTSILLSTIIVFVPVLLLRERWRIPVGATALLLGAPAIASGLVNGSGTAISTGAIVIGAVVAEVWLWTMPPIAGTALGAASFWGAYIAGWAVAGRLRWDVELWSGIIILAAALAAACSYGIARSDVGGTRSN